MDQVGWTECGVGVGQCDPRKLTHFPHYMFAYSLTGPH